MGDSLIVWLIFLAVYTAIVFVVEHKLIPWLKKRQPWSWLRKKVGT